MSSYNSFDGYAVSASYHILQEILREEWGWKNFVTTDAGAVDNLMTLHGVASSREECAKLTIEDVRRLIEFCVTTGLTSPLRPSAPPSGYVGRDGRRNLHFLHARGPGQQGHCQRDLHCEPSMCRVSWYTEPDAPIRQDRTVATLLRVKFELGLFENPYPYANWTVRIA